MFCFVKPLTWATNQHMTPGICPLCFHPFSIRASQPLTVVNREFNYCTHCQLISVAPKYRPKPEQERLRYENHENSIEDKGYVSFLEQAIVPSLDFLKPKHSLLDYGCGPSPVLSLRLKQRGYQCVNYDPFFYPTPPEGHFDVIYSTEVFEHFHDTAQQIEQLLTNLKGGGKLIIMTEFYSSLKEFQNWWYARDPTHVSFYHKNTFQYICERFGLKLLSTDEKRLVILQKLH